VFVDDRDLRNGTKRLEEDCTEDAVPKPVGINDLYTLTLWSDLISAHANMWMSTLIDSLKDSTCIEDSNVGLFSYGRITSLAGLYGKLPVSLDSFAPL
jgi:hypothetical protein